jgi:hypothetical protein
MFKLNTILLLVVTSYLTGCASVPMASIQEDQKRKEFSSPSSGYSGIYIYRNSSFGAALKKSLFINDELIGETARMTYYFKEVKPGHHKLSTESEFSNNNLMLETKTGKNYFVQQYIKMGAFVGGANLELKSEEEGKKGVLECKLAK